MCHFSKGEKEEGMGILMFSRSISITFVLLDCFRQCILNSQPLIVHIKEKKNKVKNDKDGDIGVSRRNCTRVKEEQSQKPKTKRWRTDFTSLPLASLFDSASNPGKVPIIS